MCRDLYSNDLILSGLISLSAPDLVTKMAQVYISCEMVYLIVLISRERRVLVDVLCAHSILGNFDTICLCN